MTVLSAFRYAWRRASEVRRYLRGKYILRRYTAHYRHAQRAYKKAGGPSVRTLGTPSDIGVRVFEPGADGNAISLPSGYDALVTRVAMSAANAMARSAGCRFFPPVPKGMLPERTDQVPAVVNGSVITIQLHDPFRLDGLAELCDPLLEQLEQHLFQSYAICDKVYVYRSPISTQAPSRSWLWHFDNHPREMVKVMVYLTDVSDGAAPFEYVRERSSGQPLYGSPIAPLHGLSRVSNEDVDRRLASGWGRHRVTGPRGTIVVFDDNVVHRATLARTAHRDVVVFQVRPSTFRATSRLDGRWTGSFAHKSINRDPWQLEPEPRT